MGMTCYANAVIQCMRACDKLPWLFQNGRYSELLKKNDEKSIMTKSFAEVLQLLMTCNRGQSVRPGDFLQKFRQAIKGSGFEHLSQVAPHDSYEFYLCLLDTLHEALSQEVDMKITKTLLDADDKRPAEALKVWKQEFCKKYSPFVEYSYGLLHFVVKCKGCQKETYRWEPMTAIKGVVEPNKPFQTLDEMLKAELVPEEIEGYQCDHCPQRQTAVRTTYIWKLPKYIVVVLKRFTYDGRRINTPVRLEEETVSFNEIFSKASPEYDSASKYSLIACLDHHGGAHGGHYTAQTKTKGSWYLYDDESVHNMEKPMIGASTYMMWFESAV